MSGKVYVLRDQADLIKGGDTMHDVRRGIMVVCVGVFLLAGGESFPVVPVWGQPITEPVETKTIIGDLLMVDGDFYRVGGASVLLPSLPRVYRGV